MEVRLQITVHSISAGHLVKRNKSQEETNTHPGRSATACNRSCKTSRTFVTWMHKAAVKFKKPNHKTRLTKSFQSELQWWYIFVTTWNGTNFITETPLLEPVCYIQTDASGHWGCRAHFDSQWLQHVWSLEWIDISITAKELVLIVFSFAVWGPLLTRRNVQLQCDNISLVEAINNAAPWI